MASARAKTPKKLMEQIKLKVDGVAQDMKTIGTMGENAPEIMVEYKNNLDLSLAISVVNERHRRAEEEREAVKRHTVSPARARCWRYRRSSPAGRPEARGAGGGRTPHGVVPRDRYARAPAPFEAIPCQQWLSVRMII